MLRLVECVKYTKCNLLHSEIGTMCADLLHLCKKIIRNICLVNIYQYIKYCNAILEQYTFSANLVVEKQLL